MFVFLSIGLAITGAINLLLLGKIYSLKRKKKLLQSNYDTIQIECEGLKSMLTAYKEEIAKLRTYEEKYHESNKMLQYKQDTIEHYSNLPEKLFENIANKVLEKQSKKISEDSEKNLTHLLSPLKDRIDDFYKKIDHCFSIDTKERFSLAQEIKRIAALNTELCAETKNLASALKGDKKTQGYWGELVLEKVLEASGLRNGEDYTIQSSFKNSDNKLLRPDVIINLPDNRHVIVDAKTPLTYYTAYVNPEKKCPKTQEVVLKSFLTCLKRHVEDLAKKRYNTAIGINSLDFVIMFVPIDHALKIALQNDRQLRYEAISKGILISSPATLIVVLQTIESIWRMYKQNKNTQEIIKSAGDMYEKFVTFLEEMHKIAKGLEAAQYAYNSAMNRLSIGPGNLLYKTKELKELGVETKKPMSKEIARILNKEQSCE